MPDQMLTQDNIWAEMVGVRGTWYIAGGVTKSRNITKLRPGGQMAEVSVRGKPTISDLTLTLWPESASVADVLADLERIDAGNGAAQVVKYFGDENLQVRSRRTYTGKLKEFTDPEGDANSANAATITATISVDAVS